MHSILTRNRRIALSLLCIVVLSYTFLFSVHITAWAASAKISLSTKSGPPTTDITVNGSGFAATEQVTLDFDATQVGATQTNSNGFFSCQVQIPASALPGKHVLTATGQTSHLSGKAAFLVQTDWNQFNNLNIRANPYENILNAQNVPNLALAWDVNVSTEGLYTSVAVDNGVSFVNDFNGGLEAYNATSGAFLWKTITSENNSITDSSPAVGNGIVYTGTNDGTFYAFNAVTGNALWSFQTGSQISSSPSLAYGIVYFGSNDRNIYALNAKTGKLLWSYTTGGQVMSTPAVSNGIVYVGSNDGKFYAFHATTGVPLWIIPIDTAGVAGVAVDNGVAYVSSYSHKLMAINANTGLRLWVAKAGNPLACAPAIQNGMIFLAEGTLVEAYNEKTGTLLWSYTDPNGASIDSPTTANGVVYIGSTYGDVYALDASHGALLWTFYSPFGVGFSASPVVANGYIYVGGNDAYLYAFHVPGTSAR